MKNNIRIGLAGAPGSGKSSVAEALKEKWYSVFEEAATSIINLLKKNGETLEEILSKPRNLQDQITQLKIWQFDNPNKKINFYDTTLPEDIAHRKATGVETSSDLLNAIHNCRYNSIFYMTHPWAVEKNGIRVETLDEALKLDTLKRNALKNAGYNIIEVPIFNNWKTDKASIEKAVQQRVSFILNCVKENFPKALEIENPK